MKHGNKTVQYSIYDRTEGGKPEFVADTTNLTRPSFVMLSDTIKGAGINGELDMPTMAQLGSLVYAIAFKRSNKKAVVLFGQKMQHLEVRWVTDVLDSESGKLSTCANKEIIKGYPKKLDLGDIETNKSNETSVELELTYYKFIQNGETLLEIDKLNNVFIVDGWDYAAELREAL